MDAIALDAPTAWAFCGGRASIPGECGRRNSMRFTGPRATRRAAGPAPPDARRCRARSAEASLSPLGFAEAAHAARRLRASAIRIAESAAARRPPGCPRRPRCGLVRRLAKGRLHRPNRGPRAHSLAAARIDIGSPMSPAAPAALGRPSRFTRGPTPVNRMRGRIADGKGNSPQHPHDRRGARDGSRRRRVGRHERFRMRPRHTARAHRRAAHRRSRRRDARLRRARAEGCRQQPQPAHQAVPLKRPRGRRAAARIDRRGASDLRVSLILVEAVVGSARPPQ